MTDTPRLAREIRIERHGRTGRLFIEGEEFPFHLASDDPITVGPISGDEVPTVRFTVFAERINVINDLAPLPDEEKTL